jgi:uncharacterized protein YfaS (alpha-2-macroglobulin family)
MKGTHMSTPAARPASKTLSRVGALFLFVAALSRLAVLSPAHATDGQILQFTPQGTVKKVRQVTVRFSQPMVPFGDPRGARDPFLIVCPEPGVGRWVDSRNWAYDFARDLPAGVRCTFRLTPDLRTLDGGGLAGQEEFAFSTGGPAITTSIPRQGRQSIDEEQAFLLVLDAEPTEESVLRHATFVVGGIAERVGARLVTGAARAEIIAAHFPEAPKTPVLVLQARQRFPNEARASLIWGKGITSRSGVATEQDQVLPFQVRKPFTAQFNCERENPRAGCVPVTSMRLTFSSPVPWEQARQIVLIGPENRRFSPDPGKVPQLSVSGLTFKGPFPESSAFQILLPQGLTDDAGRPLANAARFPLAVRTEAFPPLAKFSARFGIIERTDPVLPVTLRNLEPEVLARLLRVDKEPAPGIGGTFGEWLDRIKGQIFRIPPERSQEVVPWLRRVASARREASVFGGAEEKGKEISIPKPLGARAFEVLGIPLEKPGLYIVELQSAKLGASLLGRPQPMYVPTAALVTNLSVHLKWGHEVSLAWVTTLDRGQPVPQARVTVQDCTGSVLWTGLTDDQGIARITGLPKNWKDVRRCQERSPWVQFDFTQTEAIQNLDGGLFVVAQTQDDLSFVHSSWSRGIEPWRFRLPYEDYRGPIAVHTILDRSLLRAGETVHMKHILRKRTLGGFGSVPEAERPSRLVIQHLGSEQQYEFPLQWDASGIAETTWMIPKDAKLGSYQLDLVLQNASGGTWKWLSGGFRVEEFRLALTKGSIRLPPEPQVAVPELPADLSVHYLAGGAARELPVTFRALIQPKEIPPIDEFEDFVFANGPVVEGTSRQRQEYFAEETEAEVDSEGEEFSREPLPLKPAVHHREQVVLDATGSARITIPRLPRVAAPQELLAEMEFPDPNGEIRTVAGRVPLWPAHRLVGILPDSWMASKDRLKVWTAVVDVTRRPVAGVPVRVDIFERKLYSHRKRLVGGFYAYEHVEEIRRTGEFCRGSTNRQGRFLCEAKPPAEGNLILEARATDQSGNVTTAHQDVWVAGSEGWWFRAEDSDRMDVLPEKRRLEPGETARLQVRMPFREATGLVTIEREGILDAFVTTLSGSEPVIQVPMKPEYAPNVFLSVLAVRGRAGVPAPTALVDLGKPAFKLGIAELRVGWRAHELRVSVTPDRQVYQVRQKAQMKIAVRTAEGKAPPRGAELAVAAVDESLLELLPNKSWNLLEPMMQRRGYGVATATAQMQVVGKRHYGLKALPHGGGGGRQVTRELFDTLLLWKGRVPLDANGEATVEIPLNDSLTSFRIVAVATSGVSLFGTGNATIRSTQDLMVLAGLPPLVREGDRLQAEVTVRNSTNRPMDVTVEGHVEGLPSQPPSRALRLAGGEAKILAWDVQIPAGRSTLRYDLLAREPGGASDRVRVTQQVRETVPVRTVQATLLQLEQPLHQPIERPGDSIAGRGGIQVVASPSLTGALGGVRDWMSRYPYTCLEQQVSRAIALRDEAAWKPLAASLPAHLDSDGLLKYFPQMLMGSDVLTAYVLAITHETGWKIPPDVEQRMQTGLRRFVEGSVIRYSALPTTDLAIRKLAAVEALSRYAAAPSLLDSITIEPNLWPTSAVLDWRNILHRAGTIPDREARLREAEQILRARLNLQGTTMGFSSERFDGLWWLMVSPDVNAVRLILHLLETREWREDLPRLMRGTLGRQRRGAWDLTLANAWGVLAVEKFARAFEAGPVGGTTSASLAGSTARMDWSHKPKGDTLRLPWPAKREDLTVSHEGSGRPWITTQAQAAIPLKAPLSTGYRITRTVRPVDQRVPGRWSKGDVLRVRLGIEAESDMTWVVVNDPIPAGASHLGTGLGGDSLIATRGEDWRGCACFAFAERAFDGFRAYYEFFPKGKSVIEYTVRLNQAGHFRLPSTRVEALYSPEMSGELPNEALEVHP